MKQLLSILILVSASLDLRAQDDTASLSISAADSAEYYEGNIAEKRFEVKREKIVQRRAFRVTTATTADEVYQRALGFARMMNTNYKENRSAKKIELPVTWHYDGGSNECIENLALSGNLTLEIKDTKTRITLSEIQYSHKDKGNAAAEPVAKSNLLGKKAVCAPEKGVVELLYNCAQCPQSLRSLTTALENQFDIFAKTYQERLKKY